MWKLIAVVGWTFPPVAILLPQYNIGKYSQLLTNQTATRGLIFPLFLCVSFSLSLSLSVPHSQTASPKIFRLSRCSDCIVTTITIITITVIWNSPFYPSFSTDFTFHPSARGLSPRAVTVPSIAVTSAITTTVDERIYVLQNYDPRVFLFWIDPWRRINVSPWNCRALWSFIGVLLGCFSCNSSQVEECCG